MVVPGGMAATPAARQVWAWPSTIGFGPVTATSRVLIAVCAAAVAPHVRGLIAVAACPRLPLLALLSSFLLVFIAVSYKLWCSGADMVVPGVWASRSVPASTPLSRPSDAAQGAHPDLPATTTIQHLQGVSGACALGADAAVGKRARRRRRAGLCRRLRALLRRAWTRHCAVSFHRLCDEARASRIQYGHTPSLSPALQEGLWKQVFWWARCKSGRFVGNFVREPPPHAVAARDEYHARQQAAIQAEWRQVEDDERAARHAQHARIAAMSDAQYAAYVDDCAAMQDRRYVAAAIRAEVADANPKHAEFILDSPLGWYADGPIDESVSQWEDEGGFGLEGMGLGEGLGEDGALEDWADAVYEADVGCM